MLFAVTCIDKPDHQSVRADVRPVHLDYLKAHAGMVKAAGPLTTDDGSRMTGSLLIIEAADKAALDAFLAGDPYAKAGLFQSVTAHAWRWLIGNPG